MTCQLRNILICLFIFTIINIVTVQTTTTTTTNATPTEKYENESCWFSESDSDYQNFIFVYKDNVGSPGECCQFCNSNSRCMVWSLQTEIGRCYLKFDRGARVYNHGFVSGFSNICIFIICLK